MGLEDLSEKIVEKVGGVIEGSQDIKEKRLDAEVGFFGKMMELPVLGQTIRALTRPLISWFIILLFGIGQILYWIYIWQFQVAMPEFLPDALVTIVKWIIGFWFGSRGLQETVKIITKTSDAEQKERMTEIKALKQQKKLERKEAKLQKKLEKMKK